MLPAESYCLKPSDFQVFIQGSAASLPGLALHALDRGRATPRRQGRRRGGEDAGAVARMKRSTAATTAAASSGEAAAGAESAGAGGGGWAVWLPIVTRHEPGDGCLR